MLHAKQELISIKNIYDTVAAYKYCAVIVDYGFCRVEFQIKTSKFRFGCDAKGNRYIKIDIADNSKSIGIVLAFDNCLCEVKIWANSQEITFSHNNCTVTFLLRK